MTYEGIVYRPPSEARSLIVQATIGCSHNQCTYCSMYKEKAFQVRELDAIEADLAEARQIHKHVKRIFLADGDAFAMPMNQLETVLKRIKDVFPECERVGMYASPGSIVSKSVSDLRKLMGLGVGILYLGIESGSDRVLTRMQRSNG